MSDFETHPVGTADRIAALRERVARLEAALTNLPAIYAHQINTGVREVYDPLQRFYTMESVLAALTPEGQRIEDAVMAELVTDEANARFAEWFRKNYPGPDTIIHNPDWHAPKILRAAAHELAKIKEQTK